MGRSSAGGTRTAGGVGHEGRCLAWAAAYMLTADPLPRWASGRQVVAVGGQTNRPVDDVGLVTDEGGWVTIQAKKGMRVDQRPGGGLGEALRQLVEIDEVGVPDGAADALRALEPDRDLVLILSDDSAPRTVNANLAPIVNRLRELPAGVPVADAAPSGNQREALSVLKGHLGRCWRDRWAWEITETEFRRLVSVLSVRALRIAQDGEDYATVRVMLRDLAGDATTAETLWKALATEGQRLAEERAYLDRDGLVKILDAQGIVLRPLARLRNDIDHLRALSRANIALLGEAVSASTPDGPVRFTRSVEPALLGATGNLAVTGVPGSGKTVLLHTLADSAQATHDLVVLRSDDLRSSKAATRAELGLTHDLSDVLAGWSGQRPGLVLIDGIDQARGADAPGWLPLLATALSGTRWQIVATVRSFDLKHSQRWKNMFPGTPVDAGAADLDLAGVRHLLVSDLTGGELAVLRAASPHLAALLDEASPRLRELLTNPFNLDLAGQLISEDGASILQIHTRAELLAQYWRRRIGQAPLALDRTRTLRALVHRMLADGRQTARPLDLPAEATEEALTSLHHNGVLRETPARPGRVDAPTGFVHPVLFDYAVAMLALGDLDRPGSLADVLDDDPNLAMTVRPSLEYRLGDAWSADQSRRGFWRLALRLASKAKGHLLAASEAARVAALQMNDIADLAPLTDAAAGAATDQAGSWSHAEARYLVFLLAAATARNCRHEAMACIDALACDLARQARTADDVNLALLAAQLPVRAAAAQNAVPGGPGYPWTAAAAIDCMTVALKDPVDPARTMLADPAARLLALAAAADPVAAAPVVATVIAPDTLRAWGMKAIRHLTRILPAIASKAPDLAIEIGAAPWQYEETRRTPTPMLGSAILELSSDLQQDVEGERYMVGTRFAELMRMDPMTATSLLLSIVQLPRLYRFVPEAGWREPPSVRQGSPLAFAGGHQVLISMIDAFSRGLQDLAEAGDRVVPDTAHQETTLSQIIARLVSELHHGEAWKRLLAHAASAQSAALARALLPTLITASLYAHHETWNEAAHAARRAATLLTPAELARLQDAVRGIADAHTAPARQQDRAALEQHARTILASLQEAAPGPSTTPAATQAPGNIPPAGLPPLQGVPDISIQAEWSSEDAAPGSCDDLARRARERLQDPAHTQQTGDTASCHALITLWDELETFIAAGDDCQSEALDLAVEIAERLAACPDTMPDGALGTRLIATLLSAVPAPSSLLATAATRGTGQSSWASSLTPGWGVTAATRSVQALVRLYDADSWRTVHGREISASLSLLLDGPDPLYRLIASDALPALFAGQNILIAELERRLTLEPDRHVATHLMQMLARFVHQDPGRVDSVLGRLAATPHWAVISASPAGEQPVGPADQGSVGVSIIAVLGAVYGTPYARDVLDAWLTAPVDHAERATTALHCLSYLLNPADPAARAAQERLLGLTRKGLAQVQAAFADATQAPGAADQGQQARATSAVTFADHLARLLYTASGAADANRPDPAPKQRGDLLRFALLAMPLLDGLSEIHVPRVTQHIVQTTDHITSASPKRALLIVVKAVVGDEAYWREPAGADAVLGFVRHFAAENRAIFLGDREAIEAVRRLLESFIRLGWDQAIELAEELDELFS
jgi:hypothetical protein